MELTGLWIVIGAVTLLNLICAGIVVRASRAVQKKRVVTAQHYHLDVKTTDLLPEEEIRSAREQAAKKIEQAVSDNLMRLDTTLQGVTKTLADSAERQLASKVLAEAKEFESSMTQAAESLKSTVTNVTAQLTAEAEQVRKQLLDDVTKEKARKLQHFEEHMSTVVAEYMAETFDGNEDMSAQTDMITAWLERHKEDIRKDLA